MYKWLISLLVLLICYDMTQRAHNACTVNLTKYEPPQVGIFDATLIWFRRMLKPDQWIGGRAAEPKSTGRIAGIGVKRSLKTERDALSRRKKQQQIGK